MHRLAGISLLAFTILFGSALSPARAQDKSLTVFAAASMKNALDEVDAAYSAKSGVKVAASYAASSTLAKQLEQGAPADAFVVHEPAAASLPDIQFGLRREPAGQLVGIGEGPPEVLDRDVQVDRPFHRERALRNHGATLWLRDGECTP